MRRSAVMTTFYGAALLTLGSTALAMQAGGETAKADLVDATGNRKGSATFQDTPSGLMVTVDAAGLPAGTKGLHLHTVGRCEGPKFETAGSHWNPTGSKHGMENPAGPHLGDLRNIVIGANGMGRATGTIPNAKLRGGSNALLDADGAAIMIHAAADDYKTDPSGASGDRVACGIIRTS